MLDHLIGKRVVIATKDQHLKYSDVNSHYVGNLQEVKDDEVVLSDWNDRHLVPSSTHHYDVAIDTKPKFPGNVYIPLNNIKHTYELDKTQLEKEHVGSEPAVLILVENYR